MRTIDQPLVTQHSAWQKSQQNLQLLITLAKMLLQYWIVGHRIRRKYRRKEERGEIFWLDEETAP